MKEGQFCVRPATFTANRFFAVQIAVQCRWILLFGRYSLQLDNNFHYLIIFHVKTVTRMARTLARMNRMARTLARMTRTVTRMARTVTRMTRWLAHSADLSFRDTQGVWVFETPANQWGWQLNVFFVIWRVVKFSSQMFKNYIHRFKLSQITLMKQNIVLSNELRRFALTKG